MGSFDEPLRELLLQTDDLEWVDKSLAGLSHKMLWRDEETEASIALVRRTDVVTVPEAGQLLLEPQGARARADARGGDVRPAGGVRRAALPGTTVVLRQRRGRSLTWPAGTSTPT